MSFSTEVKQELVSISPGKRCCHRSFFNGMLMAAQATESQIKVSLTDTECAKIFINDLKYFCNIIPSTNEINRGFCKMSEISFESEKVSSTLITFDSFIDNKSSSPVNTIIKCPECCGAFLRGVFCACGSISDPRKTYCIEMILPTKSRAWILSQLLQECGLFPGMTERRNNSFGIYFRNSGATEDFMSVCKATKTVFELYNYQIENEIRNNENRATNCVAKNIMRTVNATGEQIDNIHAIIDAGLFGELPEELKITAQLRLDYSEESLSELASLHNPPISKSGVNHRLKKINEFAKKMGVI